MQVRAGNNALVHHMGITEVTLADQVRPEDLDALTTLARQMGIADDALVHIRPAVMDPTTSGAYDMLGVYTPGTTFEMYGNDGAKLLKGGNNLYIKLQYPLHHHRKAGKEPLGAGPVVSIGPAETPAVQSAFRGSHHSRQRQGIAHRRSWDQGGGHRRRDSADSAVRGEL